MDARKPLAVLTAQRRRMATGSFNFTMPYAYNKQTVLFAKKYRLYYYCQFHESCRLQILFSFRREFAAKRLERRSEAAQRGVLVEAAEDAAADEFSWSGTLLPRIPAPESTHQRSLSRALFVVCGGFCAQPAPRVLVTKWKRTPRAAPRPCGRRSPFHHPFRNFGARERASARSRARALRCLPRLGAQSACGVLVTRRKQACRLDAAATLPLSPRPWYELQRSRPKFLAVLPCMSRIHHFLPRHPVKLHCCTTDNSSLGVRNHARDG